MLAHSRALHLRSRLRSATYLGLNSFVTCDAFLGGLTSSVGANKVSFRALFNGTYSMVFIQSVRASGVVNGWVSIETPVVVRTFSPEFLHETCVQVCF